MNDYDNNKENVHITYPDASNLYGWSMSQPLPYGGFEWLSREEISNFCLDLVSEDSPVGYILEADLEYPSELHNLHNDYPLVPEKLQISRDMLSKYCFDIADKYGIKVANVNKLVPNLGNKSKYVVHYINLQLHLSLGMKLKKIHRVLKFKQPRWLERYTSFNTDKRKNAANKFEEDFFKLMINSVLVKQWRIKKKNNYRTD